MNLLEKLDADLKAAMKRGDAVRRDTIRAIRGAVKNREIEGGQALDPDGVLRVIRGLVKQRAESITQFDAGGRKELADREREEKQVLESYLPAAPDAAAVEAAVRDVISLVGASGPRDMGKVMKPVLDRLGPAADGKLVSEAVKRQLSEIGS